MYHSICKTTVDNRCVFLAIGILTDLFAIDYLLFNCCGKLGGFITTQYYKTRLCHDL